MAGRRSLRLATRGSPLSLAQSEAVAEALRRRWPSLDVQFVVVTTHGDRHRDVPLLELEARGDGVFTRGVEAELLADRADFAVHSLKDLPTTTEPDLLLVAFPPRGDPRDVLVSRRPGGFDDLPKGAVLGSSSPRRAAQALAQRPDLRVVSIRGNVDTRLQKLHRGEVDALILAAAGLERLGRLDEAAELLPVERFTPAVGQGALAVQCRADDTPTRELLAALDDASTRAAVSAERAFLRAVGGGCRLPLGAHAVVEGERLSLRGFLAAPDGGVSCSAEQSGPAGDPEQLGLALARELLTVADSGLPAEVRGA